MTRTIALINNKGGVGKTTSCLNIGVALSMYNKKVLLVDIDPQGNLSDAFININQVQYTIKNLLEGDITDINQEYLHTHSAIPFTLNRFIKKGKEVYSWNTASRFFPEEMKDAPIRIKYLMDNLKEVGLDDIAMPDQPKDDKLVEKCHEITFDEFCEYYDSDTYKNQGTIWNIEKNYTAIFMTKETHDKIKEKYNRSVSLVYPAADCAVVRYYDNKKEVIGLTHSDGYYTGRNIVNDMTKYMQ